MKKNIVGLSLAGIFLCVMVAAGYFSLAYYYSQGFCCGVYINDVYCTGYSIDEVNEILSGQDDYGTISVVAKNGDVAVINMDDIEYRVDYTEALTELWENQEPYKWITMYFNPVHYEVEPVYTFSEELLSEKLSEADFMKNGIYNIENSASIELTRNGYELVDDTVGLLVPKMAYEAALDGVTNRAEMVRLEEHDCYEDLIPNAKTKKVYELWKKIESFQDFEMTYVLGEGTEKIDAGVVSNWILKDEAGEFVFDELGQLVLDESKVQEYATVLGEKYDTIGRERQFKTTKGEVITIDFSKYGNDIDEAKEAKKLIEEFQSGARKLSREPIYKTKAKCQGENDIGGTYIEVDMTEQRMYFYQDYELILESGVVTGNMRLHHDTPAMIAPIYYMQRNRVLRGDNYASFVYYWMAFYRGYGLHDATWRRESEFGADTYLTNGSHGCVNLPKAVAAELYEYVEIGTPVITYY